MMPIAYYLGRDAHGSAAIVPTASVVIRDEDRRILLQRKRDGDWSLPVRAIEPGKPVRQTLTQFTKDETGFQIAIDALLGIYNDADYRAAGSDEGLPGAYWMWFSASIEGGELRSHGEVPELALFTKSGIDKLPIHVAIRRRLEEYFAGLGLS